MLKVKCFSATLHYPVKIRILADILFNQSIYSQFGTSKFRSIFQCNVMCGTMLMVKGVLFGLPCLQL